MTDTLPADLREWPRHEIVKEAQKLQAREDNLITALANLQRENRELREKVGA